MTAAPPADLATIFTPTSIVERDPYKGFTPERYEAREQEMREERARMRAMMKRAKDPDTENRSLWSCTQCFTAFAPGDSMYLTFNPHAFSYSAKCGACRESADVAPIKRSGMVMA